MHIVDRYPLAEDVFAIVIAGNGGARLRDFAPGAHVEVKVPGGVRAYSICNLHGVRDHYLLAIHNSPLSRGGARYLCEACHVGDAVQIRGPNNLFPLTTTHSHAVLIAGGIGITPIIGMADHLAHLGVDFEMHYSARTGTAAAFVDRLHDAAYRNRVHFHFRDDPGLERLNLEDLLGRLDVSQHVYLCGPSPMLVEAVELSERFGLRDRLHCERFAAGHPHSVTDDATGSFDVLAARSGLRIAVPKNCTIAAALQLAGVDVPLSCEQGVCGMCQMRVLDGIPDHRDVFLSDAERVASDVILPCVSRAKSATITLDI
ncbi:PDR/VanB family oxidoreductase [Paraburkholderia sp.]|uniref:PDR/VanB family oxidoreductase n=1 Tax=Paraburkholderia sp. TaxID=1926495 RepID=UPI003C79B3AC